MGLNFTSTCPSASAVFLHTHQGNAPAPLCCSTCGALGAVGSASTDQRGAPFPVTPHSQPGGSDARAAVSKPSVFADTDVAPASAKLSSVPFIPVCSFSALS